MLHASLEQIDATASVFRQRWALRPRVGFVLGTGLGHLTDHIDVEARIPYESIPHMPSATAPGHAGSWICGSVGGTPVVAMQGRCHLYEGYSAAQVAFGVRIMHALGIEVLVIASAAGGLHPDYRSGDVMVIEDQVNLTFHNPLVGPHDARSGLAYPDMSRPYDPRLIDEAMAIARRANFTAHRGVYVGVMGPNYETRAEYRWLRRLGGDAVGMSTVCEVIAAVQCGLRVLGLAVVTNVAVPDAPQPTSAPDVLTSAVAAQPKVWAIVRGILEHCRWPL
jgi:purine-nucleoside phosphorylase